MKYGCSRVIRMILGLMAIFIFACWVPADAQTNLIANYNPGFESSGSGVPKWTVSYGSASVVSNVSHSGSKSLLTSGSCQVYSNCNIPVQSGYYYYMSVWGEYSNFTFTNLYGMGFGLEERRSDGTVNGNWYDMMSYLAYPNVTNASSGWINVQYGPIYPKETSTTITPTIKLQSSSGQVWWDDIVVWQVPFSNVQTFVNEVQNGSFESFDSAGHPTGFTINAPSGMFNAYNSCWTCVETVQYDGAVSLNVNGACVVDSNKAYVNGNAANAQAVIMTNSVTGTGAFANLLFYDINMNQIGSQAVATVTGTNGWQVYTASLSNINSSTRYIQWEFGMQPGTTGNAYFDALQVNVNTTYTQFPTRQTNTASGSVTVDCARRCSLYFQAH